MSSSNFTSIGFGVGDAIKDGIAKSASTLHRGVTVVIGVLSLTTSPSVEEEPCLVTLEEGLMAEREFLNDPIFGGGEARVVIADENIEQDTPVIGDDYEEVSTNIVPTGFFPFDAERVVEEGKRNLHEAMYHIVMHLSAKNHPVVGNREFMTKMSEIINAWYFTPPNEACLRWTEVTMLLSQHQLINFDDPTDDVLMLLRRRY